MRRTNPIAIQIVLCLWTLGQCSPGIFPSICFEFKAEFRINLDTNIFQANLSKFRENILSNSIDFEEAFAYRRIKQKIFVQELNPQFQLSQYCNSDHCHRMAINIGQSINEFAPPCIDFYQFACDNWIKKSIIMDNSLQHQPIITMLKNNLNKFKGCSILFPFVKFRFSFTSH